MELTERENEIINLIVQEQSSLEIATRLGISVRTVDTHRKNISKKLNTSSLIGYTKYAIKIGMLDEFQYNPKSNCQ